MNEPNNIISERIKSLRKEKGYTQEQLASLLGLNSKSSIANYESGANAPSDEIKSKMCELFECTMDYLMGLTNIREPIEGLKMSNLDERTKMNTYALYEYIQEQKRIDKEKHNISQIKYYMTPVYRSYFSWYTKLGRRMY